ncbi:unnamed protein product [Rotaria sp. Silwood1]|nr:unnamed protein product [Rotaria sp. Silwood1]
MQQSSSPELVYSFNHIDTQWIDSCVIMGYNFLLNPLLLEFYTYSQPSRGGKDIVEFSSPELVYSFNHIDTQWIDSCVIMGYNFLLNPLLLEFYTYSQPSRGGKDIVEL